MTTTPSADGALTVRERQILALIAEGERTVAIGVRLGIAENTVKSHCTKAYKKIGARNRVEATRWFLAQGAPAADGGLSGELHRLQARLDTTPSDSPEAARLRRALDALRAVDRE